MGLPADAGAQQRIHSLTADWLLCERRQHDKAVILASDGLWDVISDSEAVSAVCESLGGGTAELKVPSECCCPDHANRLAYAASHQDTSAARGVTVCGDTGSSLLQMYTLDVLRPGPLAMRRRVWRMQRRTPLSGWRSRRAPPTT